MDVPQEHDARIQQLLEGARRKERGPLAALCAQYYPKILHFMHYRVGPSLAEDLTGEVFVKVMRSIDTQKGRFEPWLYRIARNVVIDNARRTKSRPEMKMGDDMLHELADDRSPQTEVGNRLDVELALQKVSDGHREFLTLKFIQGFSNNEISEMTGQNTNAIRALQFRALNAMRNALAQGGSHETA